MLAFGIVFRFVLSNPNQFAQCKSGKRRICGNPDQIIISNLCSYFLAFLSGSLVAPYNGGTNYISVFVKHNQAMHLSAYTK